MGFIDMVIDKISNNPTLQNALFERLSGLFKKNGIKSLVYDATNLGKPSDDNSGLQKFAIYEFKYSIIEENQKLREANQKMVRFLSENKKYFDYGKQHLESGDLSRALGSGVPGSGGN